MTQFRKYKDRLIAGLTRLTRTVGDLLFPAQYQDLERLIDCFNGWDRRHDVLYIGDSVVERVSKYDSDKRALYQMLHDRLRDRLDLCTVTRSAYNTEVYYYLLRCLQYLRYRPQAVIFPINMRSFSPQWDLAPPWQFDPEIQLLKEYVLHPGKKTKCRVGKKDSLRLNRKYLNTSVHYPFTALEKIKDFTRIIDSTPVNEREAHLRKKHIFIFHYMYELSEKHPKVAILHNIIRLLDGIGVCPVIYFTPINYEAGMRYVAPEFLTLLRSNVNIIVDQLAPYRSQGKVCLYDYATKLDSSCFFHDDEPTEHLNQKGRDIISGLLASAVVHAVGRRSRSVGNPPKNEATAREIE